MKPEVVLLTTSEVAAIFRVDASTIRRWVEDGQLEAITLPGDRGLKRYRRKDIEEIIGAPAPTAGAA
jgi:excisionase family DNA binding protein